MFPGQASFLTYKIPLYWRGHSFDRASHLGCLVIIMSAPQVCLHNCFHGALPWRERKGKTEQNSFRPGSHGQFCWLAGPGNSTPPWFWCEIVKKQSHLLNCKMEKMTVVFPSYSNKLCSGYLKFSNINFTY